MAVPESPFGGRGLDSDLCGGQVLGRPGPLARGGREEQGQAEGLKRQEEAGHVVEHREPPGPAPSFSAGHQGGVPLMYAVR